MMTAGVVVFFPLVYISIVALSHELISVDYLSSTFDVFIKPCNRLIERLFLSEQNLLVTEITTDCEAM